jgi:hypothetical protein
MRIEADVIMWRLGTSQRYGWTRTFRSKVDAPRRTRRRFSGPTRRSERGFSSSRAEGRTRTAASASSRLWTGTRRMCAGTPWAAAGVGSETVKERSPLARIGDACLWREMAEMGHGGGEGVLRGTKSAAVMRWTVREGEGDVESRESREDVESLRARRPAYGDLRRAGSIDRG